MKDPINKSTKKNIRKMMVQGPNHASNIQALFEDIIQACRDEFTEDNVPTSMSFLHELFIKAARKKEMEELKSYAQNPERACDPKHLYSLFQNDLDRFYLDQLLQEVQNNRDGYVEASSCAYLALRKLRETLDIKQAIEILWPVSNIIEEHYPELYNFCCEKHGMRINNEEIEKNKQWMKNQCEIWRKEEAADLA